MPGCAALCKAANTCRLWQGAPAAWPSQWRCRTTLMCQPLVYYLEGGGPLGGLCVSAAQLPCRHRRKINFGCTGGRHLGGKAVQPGQGLLQPGTAIRSGGVGAGWSGGEAAIWSGVVGAGWSGGEAAIWSGGVGLNWSGGVGGGRRSGHGVGNHVLLASMCRMSLVYSAM